MIPTPSDIRPALRRVLAFALLAGSSGAWATTSCATLSPTLERLGADYLLLGEDAPSAIGDLESFAADGQEPFRSRPARLSRLLDALRRAPLDGLDGERVRCRGTGEALREVRWRFDLEQLERVSRLDGQTVLTAFEERHTVVTDARADASSDDRLVDGTRVAEVVDVPPPDAWRASADGRALRVNRRFRRAGATSAVCALALDVAASGRNGCSYITEIDTTARVVGRTIEIEQILYIQGRRTESVRWRLGT